MQIHVLIFGLLGALVTVTAGKPVQHVGTAQQLLRSCDLNADNALNAAEFAGCLMQTSRQQRMAARMKGVSRKELLQSFMDEADVNHDLRVDAVELQQWSQRWWIFGGGEEFDDESEESDEKDDDKDDGDKDDDKDEDEKDDDEKDDDDEHEGHDHDKDEDDDKDEDEKDEDEKDDDDEHEGHDHDKDEEDEKDDDEKDDDDEHEGHDHDKDEDDDKDENEKDDDDHDHDHDEDDDHDHDDDNDDDHDHDHDNDDDHDHDDDEDDDHDHDNDNEDDHDHDDDDHDHDNDDDHDHDDDCDDGDAECNDAGEDDDELSFNEIIGKISIILQNISEGNYVQAAYELYVLVSGSELSASSQASIAFAITALENEKYGEAVGYIYAVIKEIAGGDEAGGIFTVSASTVTNVASLLQAVIQGDSGNINYYIYQSLAGVIVDFSFLSQESASSVAALIQAVIEDNTDELYISLQVIIKDIPGISSETATALTELLQTVVSGESSEISVKIFGVLSTVLEDENSAKIAEAFVAVIQAVMDGDSDEAIRQITVLSALLTGGSNSDSAFSSTTVVSFGVIINALEEGDSDGAVAAINLLINDRNSEFSSSQIEILNLIIEAIQNDDYDEARRLIVIVATSGGSTGSSSSVEISVEVFVALSSVITIVEESGDSEEAIRIIEEILSDSSITISVEVREALLILISALSDDSSDDALAVIAAIMIGSSEAYERTVSVEVSSQIELIFAALDDGDSDEAIALIEALLEGENGGSSLSIIVRNELRQILIALQDDNTSRAYAQLTLVSGGSRSSSLTVSTTASLLAAIEAVSSGSRDVAIAELELLLEDDYLDSSSKEEIQIILTLLRENKRSKAMSAIVASMISSEITVTKSEAAFLYSVLRQSGSGDFEDAIAAIEKYLEDYSDSELRFLLLYVLQLLREENSEGAFTIINTIIVETFGDDCFCD